MTAVDRGRYTLQIDGTTVHAVRARELGRRSVVVGDRVSVVGDVSGRHDTLARIVRVGERASVLRRTADDDDPYERVVVANAELLVIVTALADPPPRTGFVDRCLVAAYDAGIDALLCLTKADLASPDELARWYADLELPIVTVRYDRPPAELTTYLSGRVSVLIGHSGVGKSTLVNALVPSADRDTGGLSDIGKGRHTSTSVVALPLPPSSSPTSANPDSTNPDSASPDPLGPNPLGPDAIGSGSGNLDSADPVSAVSDSADPVSAVSDSADPVSAVSDSAAPGSGVAGSDGGGWIIDTPGIRSFGLAHVDPTNLLAGFIDLVDGADDCPAGCDHRDAAAGCALDEYVVATGANPGRLASYRRLLSSREPPPG